MNTGRLMTRWSILWARSTSATPSSSAPKPRLSAGRVLAGAAAVLLAGLLTVATASAQTSPQAVDATPAPAAQRAKGEPAAAPAKRSAKASRYRPDRFAGRAGTYYRLV